MNLFEIAVIGSILGTVTAVCIYVYLYMTYRERYMGIWILCWICYFVRLVFLDRVVLFAEDVDSYISLGFLITSTLNAYLLAWGVYEFFGTKMRSWVLYVTIVVFLLSTAIIYINPVFILRALLPSLYFGLVYIWTGIIFLRKLNMNGFGIRLTGFSIILLGFHGIDFIFLRSITWICPWGYLGDAILRFLIAFGTLLVYLEKSRNDLIHSRDCYRLLAENAVDIIYRYTLIPVPGFTYISPSIATITGFMAEEFYADPQLIVNIIHPSDRKNFGAFLQAPSYGMSPLTMRLITKGRKEVWIEQTNVLIPDEAGNICAIEGVIRDITIRRQLEHDMARLDSLNTIGEMAANLAHEIRNPMTTIRGYLQMLAQNSELTHYEERFGLMIEELDRANAIITEYLSFCKNKIVDLKACHLNKIVNALFPLLQADANALNCQVMLTLNETPQVYLDDKEIRQLILNLVRNGLEAMTSGGTLTIRTYAEDCYVVLAIQDQGGGIPPHVLENLGTPFLTTKETGTGLGLAVCYRIANRHQAEIKVKTSSTGTTFFAYFPKHISTG